MDFFSPLAFAYLAVLPVVVLFYLLKRKRVVRLISSTVLWEKFLADHQANAPFQRLRHNWLLLLQLLLLLLAIFALSRPYLAGQQKRSALRVVILDGSASMQSTDEIPSRFDKAQKEVLRMVHGLGDHDQMVLLLAAAHTEVKQSATANKVFLQRAVDGCRASDSSTRLHEALKLAETLTKDLPEAEIHLFSDGAASDLSAFENKALPLIFHRVGRGHNNAGLVALDVRANPEDAAQRAIYTALVNYSSNALTGELELFFDQQVIDVKPLTLSPGETSRQIFLAPQSRDGIFAVHWTGKDDLAADDRASIVSLLPQPVKVTLVTRGNRFLQKALSAVPGVQLTVASDFMINSPPAGIVVLDDVVPTRWPASPVLALHVANTNWVEVTGALQGPPIVFWRNTHPLLRYVSFDDVQISEALKVRTPGWGVSVVDGQQAPLVIAGEWQRQRIVWTAFDVLQSTWPLRISFPIFIANAIEWLQAADEAGGKMVQAGDAFRIPAEAGVAEARVRLPNGTEQPALLEAKSKQFVFADTTRQGVYRFLAGTNEIPFCVNLLDAAESNIKPSGELALGKYGRVNAVTLQRANIELWRWILAGAVVVLLVEWWYFHRRTA